MCVCVCVYVCVCVCVKAYACEEVWGKGCVFCGHGGAHMYEHTMCVRV